MDLEAEIRAGAVRALRKVAARYAAIAKSGTSEASMALRQAVTLSAIADELEAEGSAP